MLQSKIFTKTLHDDPKDEVSANARLLSRAGYVDKLMAGVWTYLPLGWRVFNKVADIVREEMNAIGGVEMYMPALQPKEVWEKTGRWDGQDIMYKMKDGSKRDVGLAWTHEELVTDIARRAIESYKDLPLYVYQIQDKFRDEPRAKSGLLRGREFSMKDLYSFDLDEDGLDASYERAKGAYTKVFERVGLGDRTIMTFSSGGDFSKYSHEFQTICEAGEDTIYVGKDIAVNKEVYTDEVLKDLGLDKDSLEEKNAIEVGNIFKLGTRFSEAVGLKYKDDKGKENPVVMGSYGIGIGRLMGAVVEVLHDDDGIVWPESIAPFKVHLICLGDRKPADDLYKELEDAGVEVLYDDREGQTPGERFKDADLIGIPYRVVVSEKTIEAGKFECKARGGEMSMLAKSDLIDKLTA